jgi:hypothetical protein
MRHRLAVIDLQGTPAAPAFYAPPPPAALYCQQAPRSNPWWTGATVLISVVALLDLFERFRAHATHK